MLSGYRRRDYSVRARATTIPRGGERITSLSIYIIIQSELSREARRRAPTSASTPTTGTFKQALLRAYGAAKSCAERFSALNETASIRRTIYDISSVREYLLLARLCAREKRVHRRFFFYFLCTPSVSLIRCKVDLAGSTYIYATTTRARS